jgi:hypothetical protein
MLTTTVVWSFSTTIKLVVVMSAVELWKAQQPLLTERPSVDFSKWRSVGNGENRSVRPWSGEQHQDIFRHTQQDFRIFSNTDAQDCTREFRRRNAEDPSSHQAPEIP